MGMKTGICGMAFVVAGLILGALSGCGRVADSNVGYDALRAKNYPAAVEAFDRNLVRMIKYCDGYSVPDCAVVAEAKVMAGSARLYTGDGAVGERQIREGVDLMFAGKCDSDLTGGRPHSSCENEIGRAILAYAENGASDKARSLYIEAVAHRFYPPTDKWIEAERRGDPKAAALAEITVVLSRPYGQATYQRLIAEARANGWRPLVTQLQQAAAAVRTVDPSATSDRRVYYSSDLSSDAVRQRARGFQAARMPAFAQWTALQAAEIDHVNAREAEAEAARAAEPTFADQFVAAMQTAMAPYARGRVAVPTSAARAPATGRAAGGAASCSDRMYVIRWTTQQMGETETRVTPNQFIAAVGGIDNAISQTRQQIAAIQAHPYPGNERALSLFRSFESELQGCRGRGRG
jgi:hypothetical protein